MGGKLENFIGSQLVELLIAEQRFTTTWIGQTKAQADGGHTVTTVSDGAGIRCATHLPWRLLGQM